MEKTLARPELEMLRETISDRRFEDICVQGFASEYKNIKLMIYRHPTCGRVPVIHILTTSHETAVPKARSLVVA